MLILNAWLNITGYIVTEKLFGTDGIRGIANQFPLTPEFVVHIGGAIGAALRRDHERPVALIGRA